MIQRYIPMYNFPLENYLVRNIWKSHGAVGQFPTEYHKQLNGGQWQLSDLHMVGLRSSQCSPRIAEYSKFIRHVE